MFELCFLREKSTSKTYFKDNMAVLDNIWRPSSLNELILYEL